MLQALAQRIQARWYTRSAAIALMPLACLYGALVWLRRQAYEAGVFKTRRVARPVIVVGNISVGGSGKTPLVIALIRRLAAHGVTTGVVSRGYGGHALAYPLAVDRDTDPSQAGDEPVLIATRTGAPVYVAPDRVAAAHALCAAHPGVDLVVADDGLQHYRLARQAEIAVRDQARGYGNGWLLPAGPLREPLSRLARVDLEAVHGADGDYRLEIRTAWRLIDEARCVLDDLAGQTVHAVAGIGNPERFFDALTAHGLDVKAHPMPDHHRYTAADLVFDDDRPVLMTEKDAVKCRNMADSRLWAVPAEAILDDRFAARLDALIAPLIDTIHKENR